MSSHPTYKVRFATRSDQARLLPLIQAYYQFDSIKFDRRIIVRALERNGAHLFISFRNTPTLAALRDLLILNVQSRPSITSAHHAPSFSRI
jgi:hypothetical protein